MKNVGPDYLKGEVSFDLFKSMIKTPKLSNKQITNLVDYGEEHPESDNETLLIDGIKNVTESISVDLSASEMKRLEKYAKNNEIKSRGEAAANLIIDGLDQSGD